MQSPRNVDQFKGSFLRANYQSDVTVSPYPQHIEVPMSRVTLNKTKKDYGR